MFRSKFLFTLLMLAVALKGFSAEELPDDAALETRISAAFAADDKYAQSLVRVSSHRGFILLTGQVENAELKTQATNTIVFASNAIRRIINELEVADPIDLSTAGTDATLENQVNGALQGLEPPPDATVVAVVHKGTVHLLGAVDSNEAQRLATHVSTLDGVAGVRTAFEIVAQD